MFMNMFNCLICLNLARISREIFTPITMNEKVWKNFTEVFKIPSGFYAITFFVFQMILAFLVDSIQQNVMWREEDLFYFW